jgi:phosphoglucosamine mutase
MSRRLFGTDGIRARFGEEPLVEATVRRFGAALGGHLSARGGAAPLVLVGGDTRASTAALAGWAAEGLLAAGARVSDLGTVPTGAVALLVPRLGAAAGLVDSASHNPAQDNGLKLIGADGFKWSPADEAALEARLAQTEEPDPDGAALEDGRALLGDYLDLLTSAIAGERPLAGLSIALDCAHGAASGVAPGLFERLGARVEALCAAPDGTNINRGCGSTHPEFLAEQVVAHGAHLGIALDGDADRLVLADERGRLVDGDQLMAAIADYWADAGTLKGGGVVATVMSNLGLERHLGARGLGLPRTRGADRAVIQTNINDAYNVGG